MNFRSLYNYVSCLPCFFGFFFVDFCFKSLATWPSHVSSGGTKINNFMGSDRNIWIHILSSSLIFLSLFFDLTFTIQWA